MYRTRLLFGLAGLGILLFQPAAGFAKDYCLTNGSIQLIGIGFTVPKKNSCKSWVGFAFTSRGNSPSTGTGCTAKDGSTLNLTITTSEPERAGDVYIDSVTLALPAQTGTSYETRVSTGLSSPYSETGGPCSVSIPDVVTGDSGD